MVREVSVDRDVLLVLGGLLPRLLLGVADDERQALEELDVIGQATRLDGLAAGVLDELLREGGVGAMMNVASACFAAKARPDSDEPAWYSTGVRCADGEGRCGPCTE